jgi:hypothetical protein
MEIVAPKRHKGKDWNLLKTGDNGGHHRRGKFQHRKYFIRSFYAIPIFIYS